MQTCPRCGTAIEEGSIVCAKCRLVVQYTCESCNEPVLISMKRCPNCMEDNPNYDPIFDDLAKNVLFKKETPAIENEFDEKSSEIAKEIAELKSAMESTTKTPTRAPFTDKHADDGIGKIRTIDEESPDLQKEPVIDEAHMLIQTMAISSADLQQEQKTNKPEEVSLQWECSVIVHSKSKQEPVHVGLGSDPFKAKGIPGTIIFTQSTVLFITYIPKLTTINDIFAYFAFNIENLQDYALDPEIKKNYMIFKSTGVFRKKFPGVLSINVNFSWAKDQDDVQNQMFVFQSMIERMKLFHAGSRLLGGDYLFTQGKSLKDPDIQDILIELKTNLPTVLDVIKQQYPSIGRAIP